MCPIRATTGVGASRLTSDTGRVTHYDLAVIGTGSGNSIVDHRFAGRRVAILEKGRFGGTCLNVGCIPTKMFVYPADVERYAGHGPALGVTGPRDKLRLLEDLDVFRDRLLGDREGLRQFIDGGRAPAEPGNDAAADRIGEGQEGRVELGVVTRFHSVLHLLVPWSTDQ